MEWFGGEQRAGRRENSSLGACRGCPSLHAAAAAAGASAAPQPLTALGGPSELFLRGLGGGCHGSSSRRRRRRGQTPVAAFLWSAVMMMSGTTALEPPPVKLASAALCCWLLPALRVGAVAQVSMPTVLHDASGRPSPPPPSPSTSPPWRWWAEVEHSRCQGVALRAPKS